MSGDVIPPGNSGWYRQQSPRGKRTLWARFLGFDLDAFDVQVYSLAIPAIIANVVKV